MSRSKRSKKSATLYSTSWVGYKSSVKGHDVDGILAFADKLEDPAYPRFKPPGHQLRFYCLNAMVPHYQQAFEGRPIEVVSIEAMLKRDKKKGDMYAPRLLYAMEKLMAAGRGTIRDMVAFKEMLHYYLMYQSGGYVGDSNVSPGPKFSTLVVRDEIGIPFVEGNADVYFMHGRGGCLEEEATMLRLCINAFHRIDRLYDRPFMDRSSEQYHNELGNEMTAWPVRRALECGEALGMDGCVRESDGTIVDLYKLGVQKQFNNTHVFEAKKTYERRYALFGALGQDRTADIKALKAMSQLQLEQAYSDRFGRKMPHEFMHDIFFQMERGKLKRVAEYLSEGGVDVAMLVDCEALTNYTLLHHAVMYGDVGVRVDMCQLVLSADTEFELCQLPPTEIEGCKFDTILDYISHFVEHYKGSDDSKLQMYEKLQALIQNHFTRYEEGKAFTAR